MLPTIELADLGPQAAEADKLDDRLCLQGQISIPGASWLPGSAGKGVVHVWSCCVLRTTLPLNLMAGLSLLKALVTSASLTCHLLAAFVQLVALPVSKQEDVLAAGSPSAASLSHKSG